MREMQFFRCCISFLAIHTAHALVLDGHNGQVFEHVPAAFGFGRDSQAPTTLVSQPLISVSPLNGCAFEGKPLQLSPGSILLLQRGGCNFTEKIAWAQHMNASGVIVYDDQPRGGQRWGVIMTADNTIAVQHIDIPSIFVAYETGLFLLKELGSAVTESKHHDDKNEIPDRNETVLSVGNSNHSAHNQAFLPSPSKGSLDMVTCSGGSSVSSTSPSSSTCKSSAEVATETAVFVTVNATGNVLLRPLPVGPAETLAVYVAATLFLLMASIALWVGVALSLRMFRARQRVRAIYLLKTRIFQPHVPPSSTTAKTASGNQANGDGSPLCEWRDASTSCAICLEDYAKGDLQRILPCFHCFHDACIVPWLKERSVECPLCKQPVAGLAESLSSSGAGDNEEGAWEYLSNTTSEPVSRASNNENSNTTRSEDDSLMGGDRASGGTRATSRGQAGVIAAQEAEAAAPVVAANHNGSPSNPTGDFVDPLTLHGVYGEPITLTANHRPQASRRRLPPSAEPSTNVFVNAEETIAISLDSSRSSHMPPQAPEGTEQQQRRHFDHRDDIGTSTRRRSLRRRFLSREPLESSEWDQHWSSSLVAFADLCVEDHFKLCAFVTLVAVTSLALLAFLAFNCLGEGPYNNPLLNEGLWRPSPLFRTVP